MRNYTQIGILLSLFLVISLHVDAQSHAMQAQRVAMQAHNNFIHQSRMFQNMVLMNNMNRGTGKQKFAEKYKFSIIDLDGDTIQAKKKVKINFNEPIKNLKIKTKSGEETFNPKETKEVFIKKGKQQISGIPYDNYWAFNTYSVNNLKLYSPFPEVGMGYVTLYQLGNDSIKPITSDVVAELVKGNEKAEKALSKNQMGKALDVYIKAEKKKEKAAAKKNEY